MLAKETRLGKSWAALLIASLVLGLALPLPGGCSPWSSLVPTNVPTATPLPSSTPSPPPTASSTPMATPASPEAYLPPSPTPTEPASPIEHLLLVSIDGLRPDALQQAETPNIDSLWRDGAYTWRAQTILPNVTLPAHASMLSGVTPEKHGITWNEWRPELGFIEVPTVFSIAHKAGLSIAIFVGKPKLEHSAEPSRVDSFQNPAYATLGVAQAAARYIVDRKPNLIFVHLPDPDRAGHSYGWMSPQQLEAIERTDEAVGILLEALHRADIFDATLIIVTADHGGHGKGHGSADPRDMTIPWIAFGPQVKPGYEITSQVHIYDTAATALYALGLPVSSDWDGRALEDIFVLAIPVRHEEGESFVPSLALSYCILRSDGL